MKLPNPIKTYFEADAHSDADALVSVFAPDATVNDEGVQHRGAEAIRAWWQAVKDKYHHHSEPLDLTEAAGKTVVRARVSGDFPGSPATLKFSFALAGDRITDLEIGG